MTALDCSRGSHGKYLWALAISLKYYSQFGVCFGVLLWKIVECLCLYAYRERGLLLIVPLWGCQTVWPHLFYCKWKEPRECSLRAWTRLCQVLCLEALLSAWKISFCLHSVYSLLLQVTCKIVSEEIFPSSFCFFCVLGSFARGAFWWPSCTRAASCPLRTKEDFPYRRMRSSVWKSVYDAALVERFGYCPWQRTYFPPAAHCLLK